MIRNIMVYGIQQPVIVRSEAGKTYVVDGRQRVKAAREAARRQDEAGEHSTKVPCIEVKADDARVSGIMVSTNEIRKDDDILGKARKAARLLDLTGDKDEVALAFGRSAKTIENWLKLLEADPKIHDAIEKNKISAAVGIDLAGKSRPVQAKALADLLKAPSSATSSPSKPKKGKKVVEAAKAAAVVEVAAAKGTPAPEPEDTKEHPGVKKSWVRRALKTAAAKELSSVERGFLNWILDGRAPGNSWLDAFVLAVEEELAAKSERKAGRAEAATTDATTSVDA
jgi:ParB/RepB/Spo0J family partition protein